MEVPLGTGAQWEGEAGQAGEGKWAGALPPRNVSLRHLAGLLAQGWQVPAASFFRGALLPPTRSKVMGTGAMSTQSEGTGLSAKESRGWGEGRDSAAQLGIPPPKVLPGRENPPAVCLGAFVLEGGEPSVSHTH